MKAKIQLQKILIALLLFVSSESNAQTLDWAKQIGGTGYDTDVRSAIDQGGNMYNVGFFEDTVDFDPGINTLNISSAGNYDAFIVKFDSLGNYKWVRTISGQLNQFCNTITVDSAGYIYLSGDFEGTTNFDPGNSNFSLTAISPIDIFIIKLDINGNFIWAKQIGGTTGASPRDIKVLGDKLYLTGTFLGTTDFDPGVGVFNLTSVAGRDAFVSKLDTAGNFIWAKQLGGAGTYQDGNALAIDSTGNVYVTGRFNGTIDLDPGAGVFNVSTPSGNTLDMDAFICKLNAVGDFVWGMKLGSALDEDGYRILLDGLGNVYACGEFYNTIDFDPGAGVFNMASAGGADFFLLKLDTAGSFVWAKRLGSSNNEYGIIARDAYGSLYISGGFTGTLDADPGAGVYNLISSGAFISNSYISKLDAQGNFLWAIKLDGNYTNVMGDLLFDVNNHIYARGTFDGTMDCDPGTGTYNFTSNGSIDMFFMRLSQPMVGVVNQQATAASGITVYPNPASNKLTVSSSQTITTARLLTVAGSVVQQEQNVNDGKVVFDVSTLPAGIYFAEVVTDKGRVVRKWVRE